MVMPLTKTAPASRSRTKRSCSSRSLVHTLDPSPNSVALASSTAASASGTRNTVATGPNSSSEKTRISRVTPVSTVGG